MSENSVDATLGSGADEGTGSLDSPSPESGAELGLATGEPNSFEPEEADPAVTPDPEDEPEPEDMEG